MEMFGILGNALHQRLAVHEESDIGNEGLYTYNVSRRLM